MEEWVYRALKKWPNVPALYGWLRLDRRGRWLIKGGLISRPQIIDVINKNYAGDERGCWYFQNGPQRGYVQVEAAPLVLRAEPHRDGLITHNGLIVANLRAAFLDEHGALALQTEHGPGMLLDADLDWALERMERAGRIVNESDIEAVLSSPSGAATEISLRYGPHRVALMRADFAELPAHLGFVRDPKPQNS